MNRHKKFSGPSGSAPIDGFISRGRQIGSPVNYRPDVDVKPVQPIKPVSLGSSLRRVEGFYGAGKVPSADKVLDNLEPETTEAVMLDKPIILDDNLPKKNRYFVHKHPKLRKVFKRGSLSLVACVVLVGGFLFWKLEKDISKVFHGNIFSVLSLGTKLKGESTGRVNILLAGNSADDPGHDGANLTDSIMIISLDTKNNTGYLLSVPRDLYVNYGTTNCEYGNTGKINAIYECGQSLNFHENGYPSGGMGLLEKDIDQYFGININYYALIDYSGLRDAVNAVGGINFTVKSSDPRGIYDPSIDYKTGGPLADLSNGTHLLNGEQALDLARARGDAYGSYGFPQADFNRTQNQRQELLDLKSKILSVGVLSNPAKLNGLLDAFGNSVNTDFKANEIMRLYTLSKLIPNNKIQSIGLSDNNVSLVTTSDIDGQSVVIPAAGQGNYSAIRAFMKRINSDDPVTREHASVVVLNGSNVDGLAAQTATKLTAKGLNVEAVANASLHQKTAVVMLNKNKPATESYLKQAFNVTPTTGTAAYPEAQGYNADFVIILGENAKTSG